MKHADYIASLKRGQQREYAKEIGISESFLSQIKSGRAKTPISIYDKVEIASSFKVTKEDLLQERQKRKPTR